MAYYIGIDLGGTNIVAGVVTEDMEILCTSKEKTNLPSTAEQIADTMTRTTQHAVLDAGIDWEEIEWIGIGVPGSVNKDNGIVEYANNLGFYDVPFRNMLSKRLQKPIFMDNDANAAAYGEYIAGAGKGSTSLVVVTLGTGIGGGVIVNDKILTGCNYNGAELGHMVINYDGVPCSCGLNGCFEAYGSATALIEQTRHAMQNDINSAMWQLCKNDITLADGITAFDGMRMGDKTAQKVVDSYINYLGVGITSIINILQPEILCIGGGICKEGETLLAPLRTFVDTHVYSRGAHKQTKLMIAQLGNGAGIIGAAMLGKE